jgi:hypothetical protein
VARPDRDLDHLLALALAAAEAKRPKFERRAGSERRSGADRRAQSGSPIEDERRVGRGRRRGGDRRITFTALPEAPP